VAKIARPRRTNSRHANARELEQIEDLLGEDFSSLAEARQALKKETGHIPGKSSYTVRELSSKKNGTVKQFIADLEGHTDELDALKRPNDFWAAEIYGHKTYQLFGSMEALARKLASYRGLQEENPRAALQHIKIVQVKGVNALSDYYAAKRAEVTSSWEKAKLKHKLDRARKRRQERKITRLEATVKSLRKRLK
jgi:hypothetical protein